MAALTNAVILRAASLCRDVYAHERDYIVDNSIPGFTIIAVEGTSSAGDWLTNIKFLFRNDDTHRGFKENAMRLVNQLFMREQIDFKTQLVVCGHSLGGATATVLADMLRQGAGRNVCVITLGSPRPGGSSFLPWEGLLLAPFPCLVSLGFPGWCCSGAVPVLLRTATATQVQEAQTAPAVQPRSAQRLRAFAQW
jgi:pimeloyl-ACP methyl ester carboxylesterase